MTYIDTPAESPLYAIDEAELGYVPEYTKVFALRPDVYTGWQQFAGTVKIGMDERRYELVTLAAARSLRSAYCGVAHAAVLRDRFYDDAALHAIVVDHHNAQLDPVDVAIMDFAERVAVDPAAVTAADIGRLRRQGLSDEEIFQIVLAVCVRRFFSGVLSAVGANPDDVYDRLDPSVRTALGMPVTETAAPQHP